MAHVKKPVALALTAVILMAAALMIFMHSVRVSALEDKIEVVSFPQSKVDISTLTADQQSRINDAALFTDDALVKEGDFTVNGAVTTYKYMDIDGIRVLEYTQNPPADYALNTRYAFRIENIKWTRIGTTNKYISDSIIFAAPYDNDGDAAWAASSLYKWLTSAFKDGSHLINGQSYKLSGVTLATTTLAVGLTAKTAAPTDYAKAMGASDGSWWLSNDSVDANAYLVSENGNIGADADTPVVSIHGVRPIITLDDGAESDSTTAAGNSGTAGSTATATATSVVITSSTTAAPTTAETTTTTPEPMSQTGEFGAIAVAGLMIAAGAIFAKAHKKNKDEDDD